jgi:hypothetical protein
MKGQRLQVKEISNSGVGVVWERSSVLRLTLLFLLQIEQRIDLKYKCTPFQFVVAVVAFSP